MNAAAPVITAAEPAAEPDPWDDFDFTVAFAMVRWRRGRDTLQIAIDAGLPEYVITLALHVGRNSRQQADR